METAEMVKFSWVKHRQAALNKKIILVLREKNEIRAGSGDLIFSRIQGNSLGPFRYHLLLS